MSEPLLSRRAFLGRRMLGAVAQAVADAAEKPVRALAQIEQASAAAPHRPRPLPILRPPHAVDERAFLADCTRCDQCAKACPHEAILQAPARYRAAQGTPMINPAHAACHLCADAPCVSACEPGVLRFDQPRKMGTARIDPQQCLAYRNSPCSACREHCPVEGAIVSEAGRPRVVSDRCDGCGLCQYACPAPANAVLLLPLPDRPVPREASA